MKTTKAIQKFFYALIFFFSLSILFRCAPDNGQKTFSIDYEKYELENGLDVVLHQDKSDPIVAVAILYHVGSSREQPGKTGFAHLFEHMLFQESENIPQDQFFKKIQDAGGTLNGGTSYDYTVYYEVVPKNALEKVLWMESDRMGFFINTVTESAFANQQNVVLNEKRQGVDNRPYGHTSYVISKNLYPNGHPYSWTVIGEMEDLHGANIEDVKNFYDKFYGPNNATIVLAGDIEAEEAKQLVEKYFGEIKQRQKVIKREPVAFELDSTKKLYHEDNFAKVPELRMAWPAVENYHEDSYALNFLGQILSRGKKAPMYIHMVKDEKLTSRVTAYNASRELSGSFNIVLRANEGHSLKELEEGVFESFKLFEEKGITETDLERIKAGLENYFYNGINSALSKSFQLAMYNAMKGEPGYIEEVIKNIQAVTIEDVQGVYETYVKDKPYLATSFVPKGKLELIADNSVVADVVEEDIANASEVTDVEESNEEIIKTPSEIDRAVEPELGDEVTVNLPEVWSSELSNGLKVYGIEQNELPILRFRLVIDGGFRLDSLNKIGVANLMTDIMKEGTKNKTPEEFEEEIELLGANIGLYTSQEEIVIYGNTLSRNFQKTIDLVEEMLLEPRWDEEQFELKKTQTINDINQREQQPSFIAGKEFKKLVFGEDHIFAFDSYGSKKSVESITIGDLKNFYENYFSPSISCFHVAGNVTQGEVEMALASIEERWETKDVEFPHYEPHQCDVSKIYFYDVPGAKQSVINIGCLALERTNPDYYPANVMNYKLGGSFFGSLNMILREEKGYTYGARSYFDAKKECGTFIASSSVRSSATLESVQIFIDEMNKYREGIVEDDLVFTKNALLRSNSRKFETLGALIGMLQAISKYDLEPDYIRQEEEIIMQMDLSKHKEYAQKYINPKEMVYVIVGDAETQLEPLKELGMGEPILLN